MKNLLIAGLLLASGYCAMGQNQENLLRDLEKDTLQKNSTTGLKTTDTLIVKTDTLQLKSNDKASTDTIKVKSDTAIFRIGRKKIIMVQSDDKTAIEFPDDEDRSYTFKEVKRFKGHWSGFEFGINGLMDKNQSLNLKNELAPYDLKQARSWNFNINFMQYSIGFGTDKAGLVTGMGIEFNNYHFSNAIGLKDVDGVTIIDSTYIDANYTVSKSRLSTTNLTIPLLLEFQIPTGEKRHRIYLSAGIIGGLRIGSNTKVVYEDGDKHKDKNRGDFNITTFRYGFTARAGYRALRLFANYYPVQLFEKDKGPELYPFSIGLVIIPFN